MNSLLEESNYRQTLLLMSKPLLDGHALSFVGRRSQLMERLDWLQCPRHPRRGERIVSLSLPVVLLVVVVPLGRWQPPALANGEKSPSRTSGATESAAQALSNRQPDVEPATRDSASPDTPAATNVAFDDLEGCLQKRYYVMSLLAERGKTARTTDSPPASAAPKSSFIGNTIDNP